MACFGDLSNEVLTLILSHLQHPVRFSAPESELDKQLQASKASFRALALTCRALTGLATEHLYRTISFRIAYLHDARGFELFCRTLREAGPERSKQLQSHVRAAAFWTYWNNAQTLTPEAVQLLNALPNARDLQLRTFANDVYGAPANLGFVHAASLPRLRRLFLNSSVWIGDLVRVVCFTPVETVRVTHVEHKPPGPRTVIRSFPKRRAPLEDLKIDRFPAAGVLKQLLTSIGGCQKLVVCGALADDAMSWQATSRGQIVEVLEPAKDTLELLKLRIGQRASWLQDDPSPLDLHGFSMLRALSVSSNLVFQSRQKKWDVSAWLPPRLEYLEIVFNSINDTAVVVDSWSQDDDDQWLVDIARNKRTNYPQLKHLHVWELWEIDQKNHSYGPLQLWDASFDVEAEFSLAEIELKVVLRAQGAQDGEQWQALNHLGLHEKDPDDEDLDEETWTKYTP